MAAAGAHAGKGRIPQGFHTITPYFTVKGARKFIEFLKAAFGAKELQVMERNKDEIGHALLQIGTSRLMCGDWSDPNCGAPSSSTMYLYVEDVDSLYKQALAAGAVSKSEPTDMFWGDRNAAVTDQWNNTWYIATEKEVVPEKELQQRFTEAVAKRKASGDAENDRDEKKQKAEEGAQPWPHHMNEHGYGLATCIVYVSNMDRSVQFYSDLFGFPLAGPKSDHWTEFNTGPTAFSLHHADKKAGADPDDPGFGSAAPSWFVKDMNKFHQNAVAHNASVIQAPTKQPWGGFMATYRDPDGLPFSVVQAP